MSKKSKVTITEIRDGFLIPFISETDYVFGAGQVSDEILQEDGQWDEFLPDNETQTKQIESFNCTSFGTNNCLEILSRKLLNLRNNWSDRFLGIIANTRPPGNDPGVVAEALRKNGSVPEDLLPFNSDILTVDEYYSFKGSNESQCREVADEFLKEFYFKHEWVSPLSNEISKEALKEALKRGPLGIAVFAWASKDGKYIRDGRADTHWGALYGYEEGKFWKFLDSYPPFIKQLEWDFRFFTAKRYYLRLKTQEEKELEKKTLGLFAQLLQLIGAWLGLIKKEIEKPLPPPPDPPPQKNRIAELAKAIEIYENAAKWRNNPGAIKNKAGQFLIFDTYEEGREYLEDYLARAAAGKHAAYPKAGETTLYEFFKIYAPAYDNNNPEKYAAFVADRVKVAINIPIKELL